LPDLAISSWGPAPSVTAVATRRKLTVIGALLLLSAALAGFVFAGSADAGTGISASGNIIPGAAAAFGTFTAGSPFDSGQQINVMIPPNSVLAANQKVFVLECAAPGGAVPVTINSCDGNTGYSGGTITANADGSVDIINTSTNSGIPYVVYALPDHVSLGEPANNLPACGLGTANECVLYIGQGGGSDIGLSAPHFFSQAFQVHPDASDSGVLNPGDGSPAAGTAVSPTLSTVTPATQGATADGIDPATVTVTLKDQNSIAVAGKTVTLVGASGHATVVPAQSGTNVTNAGGQATFTVTDAIAETVVLHSSDATDSVGVTPSAQITFATPIVSQSSSSVSANPSNVPAERVVGPVGGPDHPVGGAQRQLHDRPFGGRLRRD
jgi:hypothetical protein